MIQGDLDILYQEDVSLEQLKNRGSTRVGYCIRVKLSSHLKTKNFDRLVVGLFRRETL